MQLSDQTLAEFAVLTVTGILVSAAAAIMVADYRGLQLVAGERPLPRV